MEGAQQIYAVPAPSSLGYSPHIAAMHASAYHQRRRSAHRPAHRDRARDRENSVRILLHTVLQLTTLKVAFSTLICHLANTKCRHLSNIYNLNKYPDIHKYPQSTNPRN